MNGTGFSVTQRSFPTMSRMLRPLASAERYKDWPDTAPLPLASSTENEARCATLVLQKLQALWQGLTRRLAALGLKKQDSVTELMLLPLGSPPRKPVSHKASPVRFGSPVAYNVPQIPVPRRVQVERRVAVIDGVEQVLSQYGNLSDHGAFWLQNTIGLNLGTLRRERSSQRLGNTVPKSFYALEVDISKSIRDTDFGDALRDYLLQEAMHQARKDNLRLLIKPESAQQRKDYKQLGFTTLEKALLRYVPHGDVNRPPRDMKGWLAYDGFLAGYPKERIASVKSL